MAAMAVSAGAGLVAGGGAAVRAGAMRLRTTRAVRAVGRGGGARNRSFAMPVTARMGGAVDVAGNAAVAIVEVSKAVRMKVSVINTMPSFSSLPSFTRRTARPAHTVLATQTPATTGRVEVDPRTPT